jgi:mono/diheme cytochrome c family protein
MLALVAGGIAFALLTEPRPVFADPAAAPLKDGDAAKGALVFAAGDCSSCHASPGQGDRLRLGGGMALASPYGTFRPPNISPHPTDGIGRWSAADLVNALLSGVSPGHEHYYPALPYPAYAHMTLGDVADLMAYLRGLAPVAGRPPEHELSFPLTVRRFVGMWKVLFLDRTTITPDPARDAEWNRGHYLVEAVAHCAECHSSRNLLGAIVEDTRFAGGPDPSGIGYIPNITPARIGDWSKADIVEVLTTGRTPRGQTVGSSMADVVTNTAMLPESDRQAIAAFIKSLPARETPAP